MTWKWIPLDCSEDLVLGFTIPTFCSWTLNFPEVTLAGPMNLGLVVQSVPLFVPILKSIYIEHESDFPPSFYESLLTVATEVH